MTFSYVAVAVVQTARLTITDYPMTDCPITDCPITDNQIIHFHWLYRPITYCPISKVIVYPTANSVWLQLQSNSTFTDTSLLRWLVHQYLYCSHCTQWQMFDSGGSRTNSRKWLEETKLSQFNILSDTIVSSLSFTGSSFDLVQVIALLLCFIITARVLRNKSK